jgi:hypothetical protein
VSRGAYDEIKNTVGNIVLVFFFFAFFMPEERVASDRHFNSSSVPGVLHCEIFAEIETLDSILHFCGQ